MTTSIRSLKQSKEGRRILDNLQKTISFFLPTSLAQGLVIIWALLANQPLPLTPIQILWVNMVTTITLSYALGFEQASKDTMSRPPRDPNQGILTKLQCFPDFLCVPFDHYPSLLVGNAV